MKWSRSINVLLAASGLALLHVGCSSDRASSSSTSSAGTSNEPSASVQYLSVSERFPVAEFYVRNGSPRKIVWADTFADGRLLRRPPPPPPNISVAGVKIASPATPEDPLAVWWEWLPSATTPPGGTSVFRICLRSRPAAPLAFEFRGTKGESVSTILPPTSAAQPPQPRRVAAPTSAAPAAPPLLAVSWSPDRSRLFALLPTGAHPVAARMDSRPARIKSHDARLSGTPVLLEVEVPSESRPSEGGGAFAEFEFADGAVRHAYLTALSSVGVYDAPPADFASSPDACCGDVVGDDGGRSGFCLIPSDATCADLRDGHSGANVWKVIRDRELLRSRKPDKPPAFAFCAGTTPETAAVYGHIAEVLVAKPYRLGWGADPSRFVDEEADALAAYRAACAPAPFVYVPERFARHGRHVSPEELRILEWTAILSGAKGLRRHFAYSGDRALLARLGPAADATAAEVRRLQNILAPLLPVSDAVQPRNGTRVLTAWSGAGGALYLVRAVADAAPRSTLRAEIDIPAWCGGELRDLLSGEPVAAVRAGRNVLELEPRLGFRLLYAEAAP